MKNNLETIRKDLKFNKKQMAEYLGMKYTTYVSYETGRRSLNSETLIELSRKLQVTTDYILNNSPANNYETIAAHHEDDNYSPEELKEIEQFKAFVKAKRD